MSKSQGRAQTPGKGHGHGHGHARKNGHPRGPLPQPVFGEPTFSEDGVTPDPTGFDVQHAADDDLYKELGDSISHDTVSFPPSRLQPNELYTLETAFGPRGPQIRQVIEKQGQIVFHAVGDTGAVTERKYRSEIRASDQISDDAHSTSEADRPVFFYHLGDVVYNFGEARYYYDQFYDPYRNYPGPIFAIPGNHDSFIVPDTAEADYPLVTFARNFCSEHAVITPEAGSLHRSAMTQPGVYFTLDAPFVRIIGLFSNALEDPGLLSSENGKWPGVPNIQIDFLRAQLQRVLDENYKGAVLIATHHPPFSYEPRPDSLFSGGNHSSSSAMLREVDAVCKQVGFYPHAYLSAHAHNYQRYTRTIELGSKELEVPFVICGSGGHNINRLIRPRQGQTAQQPPYGADVSYMEKKPAITARSLTLDKYDDRNYGYLRVTVDKETLQIAFHQVESTSLAQSRFDLVTVELAGHRLAPN